MKIFLKVYIFGFILIGLFTFGVTRWVDKENKILESNRDSIITEHHRLQRELDWQYDSITTIFNRKLDTLIYKANKYDSLMQYEKGRKQTQQRH